MTHLGHRLSALIDGELDDTERDRALVHLARCDTCRTEANALRTLKRRMSALGEAGTGSAADSEFTRRLMGLAQPGSPFAAGAAWPGGGFAAAAAMPAGRGGREIKPAWYIALGCSAVFLAGVGSAAFLAGGGSPPAPRVTPPVDLFMSQYDLTTGTVPAAQPAQPLKVRGAARHQLGGGRNASLPAP